MRLDLSKAKRGAGILFWRFVKRDVIMWGVPFGACA